MKIIYTVALNIVLSFLVWGQTLPDNGTGIISVTVVEDGREDLLPCRAWVEINNARYYRPLSSDCVTYEKDMSFSCNGRFKIEVPIGTVMVHIERGKEYLPVNKEVEVINGQITEVGIVLKRWINMAALGWYSMDMHCHFGADSLEILKQISLADDVNFQPVLTVWNARCYKTFNLWRENEENSTLAVDPTHLVSFNNQEIERIGGDSFESVGAPHFIGLKEAVTNPDAITWPPDVLLCETAKLISPLSVIDCDKPVWGENVITAAFGLFDSAQLCHNHYHRFSDLDMCCGMAKLKLTENDAFRWAGLFWQTNRAYYSLLNCGIKLAATGGSAMGVMRVPLGYNRTYVKIDGALTQKSILTAIKKGRTFATSGPMLFFTVDGKDCGETINIESAKIRSVRIQANLKSIEPVESLEILQNGEIIKQIILKDKIPNPILDESVWLDFTPTGSAWFAARTVYFNQNRFLRQAHTSPVYLFFDNQPIVSEKDASRLISWIDKLIEINAHMDRYRSEQERKVVLTKFLAARRYYEKIINN